MRRLLPLLLLFNPPTAPQIGTGCGITDVECASQTFLHNTLYLIAVVIWWPVRGLLQFARVLEGVYTWLVESVLWSAYGSLLGALYPWVLIAGALAVLLFVSAQALIAIVQRSPVELRKGIWAGVTALAIIMAGSRGLAMLDSARQFGEQYLFYLGLSAVQRARPLEWYTTTSSQTDGMAQPLTIYGGLSPSCPGMSLRRTTRDATGRDVSVDELYLNDYAALYVYADARDIHCPPSALLLPHTFMVGDDLGFAGYFHFLGESFATLDSAERGQQLITAALAIVRLIIAGLLAAGAVLEKILKLLFLVAMTTALLGFAASRLIAFFVAFDGLQQQQQQALVGVFTAAWISYLWIGIALGITHLAAVNSNALLTGLAALGTIGVICWRMWAARTPLMVAATAASTMMSQMPRAGARAVGGGLQAYRTLATDATMVGLALATGGATSLAGGVLRRAIPALTRSTAGRMMTSAAGSWAARQRRTGARTAASNGSAAPNWANTRSYAVPQPASAMMSPPQQLRSPSGARSFTPTLRRRVNPPQRRPGSGGAGKGSGGGQPRPGRSRRPRRP